MPVSWRRRYIAVVHNKDNPYRFPWRKPGRPPADFKYLAQVPYLSVIMLRIQLKRITRKSSKKSSMINGSDSCFDFDLI